MGASTLSVMGDCIDFPATEATAPSLSVNEKVNVLALKASETGRTTVDGTVRNSTSAFSPGLSLTTAANESISQAAEGSFSAYIFTVSRKFSP